MEKQGYIRILIYILHILPIIMLEHPVSIYLIEYNLRQLKLVKMHQRHSFSSSILRGQIRRKGQRVLQYQGALTCLALVFTCPLTFLKIWTDRCRWVYVGVEDDDDDDDDDDDAEMFRSDSI